ncbi:double zinc ribbon domain-containing protein [Roseateles sp. GG27B]
MALENYRDLSSSGNDMSAGFQFEFYCCNCPTKWKSPFKPYRMGQVSGVLWRLAQIFGNGQVAGRASSGVADFGSRGAKESALEDAMKAARTMYSECDICRKAFCEDCFDNGQHSCRPCLQKGQQESAQKNQQQGQTREATATACPSCGTSNSGGRFCAECGFDMASTHKSCPSCGVMLLRQARFCTDCGHGF